MSNSNRKSKTYRHSTLDLATHSRHSCVVFKNHCSHILSQTCYSDLFSVACSSVKHHLMFSGLSHALVFDIRVACFIVADFKRHSSSHWDLIKTHKVAITLAFFKGQKLAVVKLSVPDVCLLSFALCCVIVTFTTKIAYTT